MYKVYAHVFPNNKVYVGITKQSLEDRWKNGKGYKRKNQPVIAKAIEKYEWKNIKHILLFNNLTKTQAEDLEKHFITDLELYKHENGYNSTLGGETNSPNEETKAKIGKKCKEIWQSKSYREKAVKNMKGKKRSVEAIENIRKAQLKRFQDKSQREHISAIQKGKKRSEEAKRKTSESLKKYYSNEQVRIRHKAEMKERMKFQCKKVLCVELKKEFESIKMASEWTGMCSQNLSACLQGKRKTYGGYHWRYVN